MIRKLTISLIILLASLKAFSHGNHGSDDDQTAELYAKLLSAVSSFNYETEQEDAGPFAKIVERRGVKRLLIGKKSLDIESSAFYQAGDTIAKLYIAALRKACHHCKTPTLEQVNRRLKAQVAQGWTSRIAINSGDILFERYGMEFVNLFYRYGFIAGVVKVIGEIVEDALLVVFKMPNAHFLCEVITFYIAMYAKGFNSTWRGVVMPSIYGNGRWFNRTRAMASRFATSFVVRRALKRLTIEVPAFKINDHELAHFLEDHQESKKDHKFIKWGAQKISDSRIPLNTDAVQKLVDQRHRFNKFMQGLQKQIERQRKKLDRKDLTPDERRAAEEDLKAVITIEKKIFRGKRYKRFVFLKKRKQKHSLGEFADSSDVLGGSEFWFFSLKNDLINPNVEYTGRKLKDIRATADLPINRADELTLWQSREAGTDQGRSELIGELESITSILDTSRRKVERQLDFKLMDSKMTSVLPGMAENIINMRLDELNFDKSTFRDARHAWNVRAGLFKRLSKFNGRLDHFSDVLGYGVVNTQELDVTQNLEAREYYLEIMRVFNFISTFAEVKNEADIAKFNADFDEKLEELKRSRYWVKKKKRAFSTSAITGVYQCSGLY